jgi:hypothetical protein
VGLGAAEAVVAPLVKHFYCATSLGSFICVVLQILKKMLA